MQETQVQCLSWEDPLEEEMAAHFSILGLENPMDRGAWQLTVHGVARIGHDLEIKQQQQYMLQVYNMKAKITQSCLTLCNPMDYTVHGILQARILEWVAFPFSRGSSQQRDQTQVSRTAGNSLPDEPQGSLCTI